MAISARQAELFAGEVWTTLYAAFTSINFNATDPVSINQALQSYIQTNYPEDFNDWIVSSEFVAIIDLLSWLAGTLAYKTDLAARENFIDTAESKESILRLARFLSYNPTRCQSASGVAKIISVVTDDDVYDSFGVDQANNIIYWNDPNNSNWFEQFTAVLNNAFSASNPFGIPLADVTANGVAMQLYRINDAAGTASTSFTSTVSGTSMDFEVCNANFDGGGALLEQTPAPSNAFHLYYFNDGQGNSSALTGFFLLFKQGTTQQQLFNIPVPIENQLLDISVANINQTDVWVQTVDDTGNVLTTWTQVSAVADNLANGPTNVSSVANNGVASSNITFNALAPTQRNIYSVLTRDNDQITIRFSDGSFGNTPSGNILVTYRVANGLTYQIKPLEIDNVSMTIPYVNSVGSPKTLIVNFSLYSSVANAAATETVEQIRERAPQVYATQNRMVSGEDYNVFPLQSNIAAKIKAVNRVYSGQSRYIDLNDPTGTYQDLTLFSDDGIFFRELSDTYLEVPTSLNKTAAQIVSDYILPAINQYTTTTLIRDVLMQNLLNGTIVAQPNTWTTANASLFQTTGWFSSADNLIQPGAIILFLINGVQTWVAVIEVQGAVNTVPPLNTAGPVTLVQEVPTGSTVLLTLPAAGVTVSAAVTTSITNKINLRLPFSLSYDYWNLGSVFGPVWVVGPPNNDFGASEPSLTGTQLLMMNVNYISGVWRINGRGLRYVFESIDDIEFFDNGERGLAQLTGEPVQDNVNILRINRNLNDVAGYALQQDYGLTIDRLWSYPDGTPEPRRTTVLLADPDQDGYPDAPDTFYDIIASGQYFTISTMINGGSTVLPLTSTLGISVNQLIMGAGIAIGTLITEVNPTTITIDTPTTAVLAIGSTVIIADPDATTTYLFWSNVANPPYDEPLYTVIAYDTDLLLLADTPAVGTVGFQVASSVSYLDNETFWVYMGSPTGWVQDIEGDYRMERGRGPNVAASWVSESGSVVPAGDSLFFQWQHYAQSDHRIDPAQTNIIDIFVLTFDYDNAVRQWISNGAIVADLPPPLTEFALRTTPALTNLESFKMFSDQIVWRPVQYKFLFGNGADPELQANFKVVRIPNAAVADGVIQTQIITAITNYFAPGNFDFGETFYYTEMAAYIHQQLAGLIGSIVLVPLAADAVFGDGFEVPCRPDEVFISTAQISNIVLIPSNTAVNLRIRTS
jgi:hypothetical protein